MDGHIRSYAGPGIGWPEGITTAPDGALWFADGYGDSIGRISTDGQIRKYTNPRINWPSGIAAGPDGALWFVNGLDDSIGRITREGAFSFYDGTVTYPTPATVNADVALPPSSSAARPASAGQAIHDATGGSGLATGSARAQALLVIDSGYPTPTVTIISLAGKRLPVPARVRKSPFGLSPDARRVADTTADGVRVGPVRRGSMMTVLRGDRCPSCVYGTDPSFAWSPDSRRLAAAANRSHR